MVNIYLVNNATILIIWVLLLVCCYTDIYYRIISNQIIILIVVFTAINYLLGFGVLNYIAASTFLVFGSILFYCRLIGAGDIKLIASLLLSVPTYYVMFFLVMITVLGLPLAVGALIYKAITQKKVTLPYGIAISTSYILTSIMLFTGVVNRF